MTTPEAIAAIISALALGAMLGYWWGHVRAFREALRMLDEVTAGRILATDAPGCPTSHADAQGRVRTRGDGARGGKGEMSC